MTLPRHHHRLFLGAAFIVAGELCFATMGVGIRFVAAELPNAMVVFGRNLVGLLILAPWLLRRRGTDLRTAVPALHLLRAAAGVAAMYCFFYAIAKMPLAEAMLLKLTAPIFMPLIAMLWLREQVTPLLWLALGSGFAGVVLILDPQLGSPAHGLFAGISPVALIGLAGGVLAAFAKVTVRRLSRSEPTSRIVFYFALIAGTISAVPLFWDWQTPSASALLWIAAIGGCATLGQLALTRGLTLAPVSRMGTFGYFAVVFGAAYGWLLWDEPVTWGIVGGTILIAAAGLLASRAKRPAPAGDRPVVTPPTGARSAVR